MSNDTRRFRRHPTHGHRSEPLVFETGDYTIPDPLADALLTPTNEVFVPSDFDDGEATTITRHRWR
jgi:hypothetical protein